MAPRITIHSDVHGLYIDYSVNYRNPSPCIDSP